MTIGKLLDIPNLCSILIAPPAWGKTRKLIDWFTLSSKQILLYVSPLRALADEVEQAFEKFSVFNIKTRRDWPPIIDGKMVVIVTPEQIRENLIEFLGVDRLVVFLDEFHLFFLWRSFRPHMWEVIEYLGSTDITLFAVTATLDQKYLEEWSIYAQNNFQNFVVINLGNYKLKYYPHSIRYISWTNLLHFLVLKNRYYSIHGTILCFCRYRQEVFTKVEQLSALGVKVLGCVGGESHLFMQKIQNEHFEVVCATLTLSHGINLQNISDIVFLYNEIKRDFFLQMVARGGRRGEQYNLWLYPKNNMLLQSMGNRLVLSFFYVMLLWVEIVTYIIR